MPGTGWHLSKCFCCIDRVIVSTLFCGVSIEKCVQSSCASPWVGLAAIYCWPSRRITWHQPTFFKVPEERFWPLLSSVSVIACLAGRALSGSCSNPSCHSEAWFDRTLPHSSCHLSFTSCPRDSLFPLRPETLDPPNIHTCLLAPQAGLEKLSADMQARGCATGLGPLVWMLLLRWIWLPW